MDIIKVVCTSGFSVLALFIITKIMGHKQVAQLDFFDYISGITIGSIAAELATELETPIKPFIALVIYGLISILLNVITSRLPRSRKYVNGTPTILMDNGKIYRKNLKKAKLDLSEFMLMCREAGYFDLDEIQTAIFEHNGKLSVLPNSKNRPITPNDMQITVKLSKIGTEIIMDGEILGDNLKRLGFDEIWLKKQLADQGYKNTEDIFLGIYHTEDERLSLYPIE